MLDLIEQDEANQAEYIARLDEEIELTSFTACTS
jgi:hypothetical protein